MSIWKILALIFSISIVWAAVFNLIRIVREIVRDRDDVSSDAFQKAKLALIGLGIVGTLALIYTFGPF